MNTTGIENTANGYFALYYNTTGGDNTASGISALGANSSGGSNTASGAYALSSNLNGNYNTASGDDALNANTSGSFNTADGQQAMPSNTTGSDNTASGFAALYNNTTGSNNTAIGSNTGPDYNSPNLSNATALGAGATVSQSNTLVLGQTAMGSPGVSYVNVGIGTATPRSTLEAAVSSPSALGPVLTLTNSGGSGSSAVDFNTYLPSTTGTYNPSTRVVAFDDGNFGNYLMFQSNISGAPNNGLRGNMLIYPDGEVYVNGTFSAANKEFKIDHPLDPANKFLVHSSVESSEMMNIYTGNVVTDELGLATVKLPDWFEAENTDFRYQLTVIGRQAQAWIAEEVGNGQFKIATNATNVKISWQITAVRQDAYAKAHPLIVEQQKAAGDRGRYAHPELYGQSVDMQIGGHAHDQSASAVDKHFPTQPPPALNHPLPRSVAPAMKPIAEVKQPQVNSN